MSDFIHEVFSSNVYNKPDQSPNANPNINYYILHDVMQCAKNKHMPYKTVKLKKYKHKKSAWITLGLLKSIRCRDKLYKTLKTTRPESPKYFAIRINLTTYNIILKKAYVLLNAYITNHVLTNSKITLKKHGKQLMVFFLEQTKRKSSPMP